MNTPIRVVLIGLILVLLVLSSFFLAQRMGKRQLATNLGSMPSATIMKGASAEHRYFLGQMVALKAMLYFGGLLEEYKSKVVIPPDYINMYKTMEIASHLDPYNADVYYFTQAVFTRGANSVSEVNRLLEYGMKYRNWDPMLPFFAGFNSAFFLGDFESARLFMEKAAKIAKTPEMDRFASPNYWRAVRNDGAVKILNEMIRSAPSRQEADLYRLRRDALVAMRRLQVAVDSYFKRYGVFPAHLNQLVASGIVEGLPVDPYGGDFYLDKKGEVRSTSILSVGAQPMQ